jgi:hypothetical protein
LRIEAIETLPLHERLVVRVRTNTGSDLRDDAMTWPLEVNAGSGEGTRLGVRLPLSGRVM